MIVADTNVLAYLLIPGPPTAAADLVFAADADWTAPLLWKSEFQNILALHVWKQLLSLSQAVDIMDRARQVVLQPPIEVPSRHILELAEQSRCSAYDCEFVGLAALLRVPLVTQDAKVLAAFPEIAISMEQFTRR